MVTDDEWKELSKHFKIDHEILVNRSIEKSSHSVCQPCMTKRMDEEKKVVVAKALEQIQVHFKYLNYVIVASRFAYCCYSANVIFVSSRNCSATAASRCSSGVWPTMKRLLISSKPVTAVMSLVGAPTAIRCLPQ